MASRKAYGLYLRVGTLLVAGFMLVGVFVVFLTSGGRLDRGATVYETYVRESVQGLNVGAAVAYRGVQLGRVTEILLAGAAYRAPEGTSPVAMPFQLVVVRFAVEAARLGEAPPEAAVAVQNGLRARVASQGLTGVSYVELDFVDPERYAAVPPPWTPRYPVIPAVPSTLTQAQDAAQLLLQRLEGVPFDAIVGDLAGLLADLRRQVGEGGELSRALVESTALLAALREATERADLPGLTAELRGTARDVRGVASGPEVRATLRAAQGAAEAARTALARLPQTLQTVEGTARAARATASDTDSDLAPILRDLRATASALRDVSELLRRSPSQAILGGSPPPPDWATQRRGR